MKNKWTVLAALTALLCVVMTTHSQQQVAKNLSMIELIANPEKYDGRLVLITGYLRLEHEGDVIYLNEPDYLHSIPKNGLWVERTPEMEKDIEKLDSNYVLLVGTFNARRKGHRSLASGSIENVRSCTLWSKTNEPVALQLRQ